MQSNWERRNPEQEKPKDVAVAAPPPPPPPVDAAVAVVTPDAALPDAPEENVLAEAQKAYDEAKSAERELKDLLAELDALLAQNSDKLSDEAATKLKSDIERTLAKIKGLAGKADAALKAGTGKAGKQPTPPNKKLLDESAKLVAMARETSKDADLRAKPILDDLADRKDVMGDGEIQATLTSIETALDLGNLASAKAKVDKLAKAVRDAKWKTQIDNLYGKYFEAKAGQTSDAAGKRKLLEQALAAYQRAAKGSGGAAQQAKKQVPAVQKALGELPPK